MAQLVAHLSLDFRPGHDPRVVGLSPVLSPKPGFMLCSHSFFKIKLKKKEFSFVFCLKINSDLLLKLG